MLHPGHRDQRLAILLDALSSALKDAITLHSRAIPRMRHLGTKDAIKLHIGHPQGCVIYSKGLFRAIMAVPP